MKPYTALFPGVNAFGGANISVTVGRGKNREITPLPHISIQTKEHHLALADHIRRLVGVSH